MAKSSGTQQERHPAPALPPALLSRLGSRVSAGRRFKVSPVPISPSLAMRDILRWGRAAQDGKPIPFSIDPMDGSPPVTVMMPIRKPRISGAHRRIGRPRHPLTLERYLNFIADPKMNALSATRQAQHLTIRLRAELGPDTEVVTRAIVRARRAEIGDAERRRRTKKHGRKLRRSD
jgi:hypothetical protein